MIVRLEPDLLEQLTSLDNPSAAGETAQQDGDLAAAMRHAALTRRLFYIAVLIVALYGTATGVATGFGLPWWVALGGTAALELGGVVFLANADVRRRLGEHAAASRLLGAGIAGTAATFNIITHPDRLLGGLFALMSLLGFASWWIDADNRRRDRLRARGLLPPPTPKYALWSHWIRHPVTTAHARSLAHAHPDLGLYGSLQAALTIRRRDRRNTALADALRTRLNDAVGAKLARIAVLTYDMDEVARRLRDSADYDTLTALIGRELAAERLMDGRNATDAADQAQMIRALPAALGAGLPPVASTAHAAGGQPTNRSHRRRGPASPVGSGPSAADEIGELGQSPTPASVAAPSVPGAMQLPSTNHDGTPQHAPLSRRSRTLPAGRDTVPNVLHSDQTSEERSSRADILTPSSPSRGDTASTEAPAQMAAGPVQITVLGKPAIRALDGTPANGIRAKSLELLVFLVIHRHGATATDILTAIWPDVPIHRANQRLSTCVSNLRATVRAIAGTSTQPADPAQPEPIVNTGGRYHLNPAAVSVDWWDLLDQHTDTADENTQTLAAAAARIANEQAYPWQSHQ